MKISEICIKRPVFATVINLVVLLVGLIAFQRLAVREYPNIDEPTVSVETTFRGASADVIESQITQPLEESLSGIDGVEVMTSISRAEKSQITVKFRLNRNNDGAAADVRDRVARVRALLPTNIDEPVVAKVEADAQPVIYLSFYSSRHSTLEVTDYADRYVKDRLQNLDGVSQIRIFGERRYAMRLWLDRTRLAAYGLTPQDIEAALRKHNVEVPGGRIESTQREFTVLAETDLKTAEEFNALIVKETPGYLVRLRDVGEAKLGARDERIYSRFNGQSSVSLGVVKQATANPLDVTRAVRAALPLISRDLPAGMAVSVGYDTSVFIERSISNVFSTVFEAMALVALVIFFFLRSLRGTIIPLVTIPIALIGAFALMWLFGFSLNTLTLLAFVLAIGLVVDDAIVMLENISRYVEGGMKPMEAALKGSKEIGFAVLAMTLTLAAVYAPIAFQEGRTGRLFAEFALTLAGAVVVSGFTALALSPMMCSRILKHSDKHGWVFRVIERFLDGLRDGYRRALEITVDMKALVLGVMVMVGVLAFALFRSLPSELAPVEDRGTIIALGIAPEGSTVEFTLDSARKMEAMFERVPYQTRYFAVIGFPTVSNLIGFVGLKDWSERPVKQQALVAQLSPQLFGGIPGLLAFATNPQSLGQRAIDKPVSFVLQTSAPYSELEKAVNQLMAAARQNPGLTNLDSDLRLNKPELKVAIDRDKAADLGIDVEVIGRTLETMLGGRQVTRFKLNGKQYDVMVQVADTARVTPRDLTNIYVRSRAGEMVPLANLVTMRETVTPRELNHFNKLRSATITATLATGFTLGDALDFLEAEAKKLPNAILHDLDGQSREFRKASGGLYMTFLLALAFIYLVLSAQFESFVDPLIIMLTVPLSMAGALLALKLTGGTLNVYSQIGLVTLVGLITKHGILIVEFANQLQERGAEKRQAVIESAVLRLRPIMMTTGAMVLGSLPLAIASGAGAESRQQIGWVIVGGLLMGTLFTLFVVPTAYMILAKKRKTHAVAAGPAPAHPAPAE